MQNRTTAVAGVAGAIIGAGVTAGVVALSDSNTRKKVGSALTIAGKNARKMLENARKKKGDKETNTQDVVEKEKKSVEDSGLKTVHNLNN